MFGDIVAARERTGCRRGEVLHLRSRDISEDAIRHPDAKTDPRHDESPGHLKPDNLLATGLRRCWARQAAPVRPATHTAASQAVMASEGLPLVGKLLGHQRHSTTAGYARRADIRLVETAAKVSSVIAEATKLHVAPPPSHPCACCAYGRWI